MSVDKKRLISYQDFIDAGYSDFDAFEFSGSLESLLTPEELEEYTKSITIENQEN